MGILTLDEYKKQISQVKDLAREELYEVKSDEFLHVMPCFRDDDDTVNIGVWHAYRQQLETAIHRLNPRALVPIHTESTDTFREMHDRVELLILLLQKKWKWTMKLHVFSFCNKGTIVK